MKATLFRTGLCVGFLAAISAPLMAAPLRRSDVPAAALWVLHVDCDNLRPTAIGRHLLAEMEKAEAAGSLATLRTTFNFDPRRQLHGLTLYGASNAPEDGVMLVYADFEAARLVAAARGAKHYQSTTNRQYVIHSWLDEPKHGGQGLKRRVYAAIHSGSIVVFSRQEPGVAKALNVLDRASATLAASRRFAELGAGGRSSFVQFAAGGLDLQGADLSTALLRYAKAARLEAGEERGELKATLNLQASDEEAAKHMVSAAQGLLALMKFRADNPVSVKLVQAIALKQDGADLAATLAVSSADAIEAIKANTARKAHTGAEKN
ncbi:MAG TPA: hypothetical protein PLU91_11925 [Verrucomicrobiota bacterium]|nr:hypothetical protein [Verrucomicrobiota bacterium]